MIQRKNNISTDADEISFTVSFSSVDVWSWLHHFCFLLHRDDPHDYNFALDLPKSKMDFVHYLVHSTDHGVGWMPEKKATLIAEWAFELALRKKYIKPSKEKNGIQYYAFTAMMTKKNGRPRKEDMV